MAATGALLTLGCLAGASVISSTTQHDYWYDILHYYNEFDAQYTATIDKILMKHGYVRTTIFRNGVNIPGYGTHYLRVLHGCKARSCVDKLMKIVVYLGFIRETRKSNGDNDGSTDYYKVFYFPGYHKVYLGFCEFISKTDDDSMNVMHIDTSSHIPKVVIKKDSYKGDAMSNQRMVVSAIVDDYITGKLNNMKVIISGTRGVGKTYISKLVKRYIDKQFNKVCQLFYNFNPTQTGVDIITLALSKASEQTPVILVVNEVTEAFDSALSIDPDFDARSKHARNRSSFNDMLDAIDNTGYVIAIFTTEKSIDELRNNADYRSFIREGRINKYITLTKNESIISNAE